MKNKEKSPKDDFDKDIRRLAHEYKSICDKENPVAMCLVSLAALPALLKDIKLQCETKDKKAYDNFMIFVKNELMNIMDAIDDIDKIIH